MIVPLQITFRDMDSSAAIDAYVRARAEKLDALYDRITACRVAIESPHRHKSHGRPYRVRVDINVPGAELVVDRSPDHDLHHKDLYAAIDAAFDDAKRQLHDYVARRRARAS
jgi:ribosomal subunit interface protein